MPRAFLVKRGKDKVYINPSEVEGKEKEKQSEPLVIIAKTEGKRTSTYVVFDNSNKYKQDEEEEEEEEYVNESSAVIEKTGEENTLARVSCKGKEEKEQLSKVEGALSTTLKGKRRATLFVSHEKAGKDEEVEETKKV